jgi:hypothetical protein
MTLHDIIVRYCVGGLNARTAVLTTSTVLSPAERKRADDLNMVGLDGVH